MNCTFCMNENHFYFLHHYTLSTQLTSWLTLNNKGLLNKLDIQPYSTWWLHSFSIRKIVWMDQSIFFLQNLFWVCGELVQVSSVPQSCLTLPPHGLQHAWLPCPSLTPRTCSNSCPWSQWCHPTISCPVIPFSSCLQSFPTSRAFPMSHLSFRWPEYWSFSFSISPSNEHPGLLSFRMDWLDLLAVQETLKSLLQHHSSKASILQAQLSL